MNAIPLHLLDWLTEGREERAITIEIHANDPEWPEAIDDPTVHDAIWSWDYTVILSEVVGVGDWEDPNEADAMVTREVHTQGDDLAMAAATAVRLMRAEEVCDP